MNHAIANPVTRLAARIQEQWRTSGTFRRRVSILAGGTALAQSINFAVAPILTRVYDARAFGNLQLYGSLLNFAMIVIALRYELAVVIPQDDKEAVNVVSVGMIVVLVVSALLGGGVWVVIRTGLVFPGTRDIVPYLWLLPVGACGVGIYQLLVYWALRHHAYKTIAASKLTQVASQAGIQLCAGMFTKGALLGLLVGDVCGRIGGSWRIAKLTFKSDKSALKSVRPATMWQAARRYRNYPLIMTTAGFINSAGLQAVPIMLSAHYGPMLVGLFALVDRTMQAPIVLVAQSTSQVYIVQVAELGSTDPAKLKSLFSSVVRSSLLYGLVPVTVVMILGPQLFAMVFGSSWHSSGEFARILAPAYYLCFAHQCVCMTLPALERQAWQAAWDSFRLVSVALTLLGSFKLELDFTRTLLAYSTVSCISYALNLLLCYLAIVRKSSKPRVTPESISELSFP